MMKLVVTFQGLVLVTSKSLDRLPRLPIIDGKTYFYDNFPRTWIDARRFCAGFGMRLGTIQTEGQQAFLISQYSAEGFDGLYWFGAVDSASSLNHFVWDVDHATVPDVGQKLISIPVSAGLGLLYRSGQGPAGNGAWIISPCSAKHFVLCETIV